MKSHEPKILLGAHLSISGGLEQALIAAKNIHCTCVQIFTHSNRQWHLSPLKQQDINLFKQTRKEMGITLVVTHCSYLINIASPKKHVRALSIKTLSQELVRCQELDIPYLVVHPGSHLQASVEEGIAHVIEALDIVCKENPGPCMILLENMAGQGSTLGATFEQLASIKSAASCKKRIGFCLDTCHAFAAGYDFTTPASYQKYMRRLNTIVGLDTIKVIHLNDSKSPLHSHVDRHTNIGDGKIGPTAFKLLMNDPQFFSTPKILETPHDETLKACIKDLNTLRGFISSSNKRMFAAS
jgi:deoxyribonuclease IV